MFRFLKRYKLKYLNHIVLFVPLIVYANKPLLEKYPDLYQSSDYSRALTELKQQGWSILRMQFPQNLKSLQGMRRLPMSHRENEAQNWEVAPKGRIYQSSSYRDKIFTDDLQIEIMDLGRIFEDLLNSSRNFRNPIELNYGYVYSSPKTTDFEDDTFIWHPDEIIYRILVPLSSPTTEYKINGVEASILPYTALIFSGTGNTQPNIRALIHRAPIHNDHRSLLVFEYQRQVSNGGGWMMLDSFF